MLVIKNLDWSEILDKTAAFATSEQGKNLTSAIVPLASADEAEKSFYEIECATGIL